MLSEVGKIFWGGTNISYLSNVAKYTTDAVYYTAFSTAWIFPAFRDCSIMAFNTSKILISQ